MVYELSTTILLNELRFAADHMMACTDQPDMLKRLAAHMVRAADGVEATLRQCTDPMPEMDNVVAFERRP